MYYPLIMIVWIICWMPNFDAEFPVCKVYYTRENCEETEVWIRRLNLETTGCEMIAYQKGGQDVQ